MFRVLWQCARRYSAWTLVAVVATAVFAGSSVVLLSVFRLILSDVLRADGGMGVPFLSESVPDEGTERSSPLDFDFDLAGLIDGGIVRLSRSLGIDDSQLVWYLPTLFALIFVGRSLAAFANGYTFQVIGLGSTNDLRNLLYERILGQSSRFYAEHPSGELVSRVSNDIAVIQNAVSNRLLDLFNQSFTVLLLVWYMLSLNFRLAVLCLVVAPAVFFPIVRFGQSMRRTSRRTQERLADLSSLVAETVRGHRVVKAFGMERFELDRFHAASRRHLKVKLKAQLLAHASGPVVETLVVFGACVFLVYAGQVVRRGELTPSEIVTFLTALMMLYEPIRKLNKVNLILQEALAAARRVVDVIETENDVEDAPGATELEAGALESADPLLTFEGVSFSYPVEEGANGPPSASIVLRGIDLAIRRGEVVALVGPSGAGKSTLANLLPRFFDPVEGRLTLAGHDLRRLSLRSLREQIGLVTQDTVLFNDTIRNNIAYGRSDLPLERVREAAAAAYADDFVTALPEGYATVIGEGGLKLSGGQRQRLAIARAILKDPPILILDEATSHLDSESEALVQKALSNLMVGRTALVIAHRLSTVQRADRILVMDQGRVVEEGTHEELLANGGIYQRLYELQFRDV